MVGVFTGMLMTDLDCLGQTAKTVMAHCVYSGKEERQRMKENGVFIAHCPEPI